MIRKLAIVATLALSALVGVTTGQPADAAITDPEPAPATMARCQEEDGYGVALCRWDGIVSGDCAPAYLAEAGHLNTWQRGNAARYCLRLHPRPAITTRYADGTVTRTPAGPVLVRECVAQYRRVELVLCLAQ